MGCSTTGTLATASYNAGEGKILTAMKKAQSDDFWEISNHRYLKKETKEYVPMFLAAMTIAKEPQKYGFSNIEYHPPLVYEKVSVPPSTNLALIARAAETDLAEIRALNPALLGKRPLRICPALKSTCRRERKKFLRRIFHPCPALWRVKIPTGSPRAIPSPFWPKNTGSASRNSARPMR